MHLPYACSCCSPAPGLTRRRLLLGAAGVGAGALLAGCAATGGGVAPAGNSYVLRGGHVISMDPAVGDIAGADVLVQGGPSPPSALAWPWAMRRSSMHAA